MDNTTVKYDEEFDFTGMDDQEFLGKISRWMDRANSLAENATAYPVFVGRKIIGRLLDLAKKSPSEVVYVQANDWQALYVDGYRVTEGTSIDLADVLDGREMTFSTRRWFESDIIHAEEFGGFPNDLDELLKFTYQ